MTPWIAGRVLLLFFIVGLGLPGAARADDRVGGHCGVLFPLVTRAGGETTTIGDQFKIGFPMGITIKTADTWAFDLELVPVVTSDRLVSLTVHPGLIHGLGNHLAAGLRMAFASGTSRGASRRC